MCQFAGAASRERVTVPTEYGRLTAETERLLLCTGGALRQFAGAASRARERVTVPAQTCIQIDIHELSVPFLFETSSLQQEECFFFFLVSNEAMSVGGSTLQMHFVWPVRDGSSFSVA